MLQHCISVLLGEGLETFLISNVYGGNIILCHGHWVPTNYGKSSPVLLHLQVYKHINR